MKTSEAKAQLEKWMMEQRLALRTRDAYRWHAGAFLRFRPEGFSGSLEDRVSAYLSTLSERHSTAHQKQALNAIVALCKALGRPLGELPAWARPAERRRVPVWVTTSEALSIFPHLREPWNEVAMMLFGSGLRIMECLRLRIKDVDLESCTVTIYRGKGDKDRIVPLARCLVEPLRARRAVSRAIWEEDRAAGRPGVYSPVALKYPRSGEQWPWFWLWPAPGESRDPDTGIRRRHHRHEDAFAKALAPAVQRAKVNKRVTAHAFRHGFATAYLAAGGTIQELQELLGHAHLETTEIYTHCLPKLASRVPSPLDIPVGNIVPFDRAALPEPRFAVG